MLEKIKVINKEGELVVSSREVAKNFDKKHIHVLRTIEDKIKMNPKLDTSIYFIKSSYLDSYGREQKEYLMTRDGFSFLVMGFTGHKADEWKIRYIEAFNEMEEHIKKEQQVYKIPKTPMEAMRLMFQVSEEHESKINTLENKVIELGENAPLSPSEYSFITKLIRDRINFVKSTYSKTESTKLYTRELYRAINKDIDSVAGVYTRSQLRKKHFNTIVELIKIWTPSAALNMRLEQLSLES